LEEDLAHGTKISAIAVRDLRLR